MFGYYALQKKNFTRVIEKLQIAYLGYLFSEECSKRKGSVFPGFFPYNMFILFCPEAFYVSHSFFP